MRGVLIIVLFFFKVVLSMAQPDHEIEDVKKILTDIKYGEKYKNKGLNEQLLLTSNLYYRSKEIGYEEGKLMALTIMAGLEFEIGNISSCLEHAQDAWILANKLNRVEEQVASRYFLGVALIQQGYLYKGKDAVIWAFNRSKAIVDKNERHWQRQMLCLTIAEFYGGFRKEWKADLDSAKYYLELGYKQCQNITEDSPYFKQSNIRGELYSANLDIYFPDERSKTKFLLSAEQHLEKAYKLAYNDDYKALLAMIYILYSDIEERNGNIQNAIKYRQQAIPVFTKYNYNYHLSAVLSALSLLHGKIGEHEKEAYYLKQFVLLADSLYYQDAAIAKPRFPTLEVRKSYRIAGIYLISILLIIGIILLIYFRYRKGRDQKGSFIAKNDFIEDKAIDNNLLKLKRNDLMEIIQLAKSNSELFFTAFSELYPDFKTKLLEINPLCSFSDCEFCALLKLNFDTKQIARYRNLSIRSVESKKYRVRKKLGLGSEIDIYAYFMDF